MDSPTSSTLDILIAALDRPGSMDGPRSWVIRLSRLLRERGLRVGVVTFPQDRREGSMECALRESGTPVWVCPTTALRDDVRWLVQQVQERRPAVLLADYTPQALTASQWLREAPVHTVAVIHSDEHRYERLLRFFIHRSPCAVRSVVCVSRYLADRERELGCIDERVGIHCVPCSVPLPDRPRQPREPGRLRLLYVGRLVQRAKRILETTQALVLAAQAFPEVEVTLIGEGHQGEAARALVRDAGLEDRIRFRGLLDHDATLAEMLAHDVIVLLSDFEGLPLAVTEAMARGLVPIVTPMRSGIPELVEHEQTGLITPDREAGFVACVGRLLHDPALWERCSAQARHLIEERYSDEVILEFWCRLIAEAAAEQEDDPESEWPVDEFFWPDTWKQPWGDATVATLPVKPIAAVTHLGWTLWKRIPIRTRLALKKVIRLHDSHRT